MLARILYIAVALTALGAFSRPVAGRAVDARSGSSVAPGAAAFTPRSAAPR